MAPSSINWLIPRPPACPRRGTYLRITGRPDVDAAWRWAVNLRPAAGGTRVSRSPVAIITAGYLTSARTFWTGEYARRNSNCSGIAPLPYSRRAGALLAWVPRNSCYFFSGEIYRLFLRGGTAVGGFPLSLTLMVWLGQMRFSLRPRNTLYMDTMLQTTYPAHSVSKAHRNVP